jgi:hypothetical protein
MLTYHAPQMKYWRNMKMERCSFTDDWVWVDMAGGGVS